MSTPAPGWMPDPCCPTRMRWWDGSQWTDHVFGVDSVAVPTQPVSLLDAARKRQIPPWAWVLVAAVGALFAIALAPVSAVVALLFLVTGAVALFRGTPTWLRFQNRRTAGIVTAAAAATFFVTGGLTAALIAVEAHHAASPGQSAHSSGVISDPLFGIL